MTKLFVSHASLDAPLVEAFVDLLEVGVGIPPRWIFCSSLKSQNIKPGRDFVQAIRKNLDDATCVIAVVSEAYYASAFCMCELGATWALEKELKPVIVAQTDRPDAKAILAGLQQLKIASASDLDELRDELIAILVPPEPISTPRWNKKRQLFIDGLPVLLKQIAFKGDVPRATFEKLSEQVGEYKAECDEYEKRLNAKDALITDLKKSKNASDVKKVVRKHSAVSDQFKELVRAVRLAFVPLPREACEALYYETRRERYVPKRDDWDDVQAAAENGFLLVDEDEGTAMPKDDNRAVAKAQRALSDLDRWLASAPPDFVDEYTDGEGEPPDLTLRSFWKRHF